MWRRGANQISQRSHQLYCQPGKRVFITLTPPRPLSCHPVTHPPGQLCCVTSDFDFIKLFFSLCFVLLGSFASECQLFLFFLREVKRNTTYSWRRSISLGQQPSGVAQVLAVGGAEKGKKKPNTLLLFSCTLHSV